MTVDIEAFKKLGGCTNGETWKLLTQTDLTGDERIRMLTTAYASLYLWGEGGATPLHYARAHWLISRVLCVLGEASLADQHVQLCGRFTAAAEDRKDFDDVYLVEAQARVAAAKGDRAQALELKARALALAALVTDAEDRDILEGDLKSGPWFGCEATK